MSPRSRIMQATWALFAASATRVKSRRKGSVDEQVSPSRGGGGTYPAARAVEELEDCWEALGLED